MKLELLDSKRAEIVVGTLIVGLAAIVIRQTLILGAGWGPSGPQPGFFPFWSAITMGGAALITVARTIRASGIPLYESKAHAAAVLKVGAPLAAAVVTLEYLGFYLMSAVYMGFFSAWHGRHRWPVVLAASILLPIMLFFVFERGFKLSMPKSVWYGTLLGF